MPLGFFRASAGTYLALLGFDLEIATGTYRLEVETLAPAGTRHPWSRELAVEYKAFPTRKITVDQKYVTPKEDDNELAEREMARLTKILSDFTTGNYLLENFSTPVPKTRPSNFGERRIFNGIPKSPHSGVDLRAPMGTPVRAPAGGKVVLAAEFFYQGKIVAIDHGYGLFSYYMHLSEIPVKEGTVVSRGDLIGKVGRTGRASGPHLHWSVRVNSARVDPFSLLSLNLERYLGAAPARQKQRNKAAQKIKTKNKPQGKPKRPS
jgi:murein DD-endopeptidase MepM/ murein hydrolase activator NlpD